MHIILVGLNHRTAPVALREQFSLAECGVRMALEDLGLSRRSNLAESPGQGATHLREAVFLSTCNRFEVYAGVIGDLGEGRDLVEGYLARLQGIPSLELRPHLYFLDGREAVIHLLRVAAGLDFLCLSGGRGVGRYLRRARRRLWCACRYLWYARRYLWCVGCRYRSRWRRCLHWTGGAACYKKAQQQRSLAH